MSVRYNAAAGRDITRLGALADGLFAIALTLIVLEIKLPDHATIGNETALREALLGLAPRLVTYLLSFLTLGIFWVGQQTQLSHLKETDRHLTWLHLMFLAIVATMPVSTELLSEYITFRTSLVIYWATIAALGFSLLATWTYAERHGLVREDVPPGLGESIRRRIYVAQALYAVGALLCVVDPRWSIGFIVLLQINYAFAPRFLMRWTT